MRGLTVGLSGEALNVSRALTTTSHLLGDMHTSYYQIDIMCACIFFHPFINVHLNQQNIVSFSHWKEKKKLHSNSRLFVKSITDLYMDFIYNIYINIFIYIKYTKYMKMSFVFLMIKQNTSEKNYEEMAAAEYGEALLGTVWAYGSALSRAPSLPWGLLSHKFLFLSNITSQGQFPSSAFSSYSSLKFGFTPTSLSSFQWKTIYFYSVDLSAKPSLVNGRQWLNLIKIWMQYKSKTRTGEFSNHTDKAPATIKKWTYRLFILILFHLIFLFFENFNVSTILYYFHTTFLLQLYGSHPLPFKFMIPSITVTYTYTYAGAHAYTNKTYWVYLVWHAFRPETWD